MSLIGGWSNSGLLAPKRMILMLCGKRQRERCSMEYPTTEGKNGLIYHIAQGIYVGQNPHGNWEVIIRTQNKRKRKSCGDGQDGLTKATKMAELMAAKMGLLKEPTTEKRFSDVADEWVLVLTLNWG
jgi:hypothetical protein